MPITQPQQEYRRAQFDELISENDCAFESGAEYPKTFDRYLVVEKTSGEIAWFYLADSLEECAQLIDESDTDRDLVHIFDLDEDEDNHLIIPVIQVTAFLVSGQEKIDRNPNPIRKELESRFPWLLTDEEAPGGDAVDAIARWYEEARA